MKNRLVLIIILAVAVVGAGGFFLFSNGSAADVNYRFDKVTRGDIQVVVTATGTLSADTTVQVGTQVSGTIQKLSFQDPPGGMLGSCTITPLLSCGRRATGFWT